MSSDLDPTPAPRAMVVPFPVHGPLLALAYRELHIAATGDADQKAALGDLNALARPWDPATCHQPELRRELWQWLDAVVTWLNTQYVWDVAGVIPACWPQHPHLVHEVTVLADRRRWAAQAFSSDALEDWHRHALPFFLDRMTTRLRQHCENGHQPCPATGRLTRHTSGPAADARAAVYEGDVDSARHEPQPRRAPRLTIIDNGTVIETDTGEIIE